MNNKKKETKNTFTYKNQQLSTWRPFEELLKPYADALQKAR